MTRRIRLDLVYFCWDPVFTCFKNKTPKIGFTKLVTADLSFPCRELFNGGLGIVVALLICWKIDFLCACCWSAIQPYEASCCLCNFNQHFLSAKTGSWCTHDMPMTPHREPGLRIKPLFWSSQYQQRTDATMIIKKKMFPHHDQDYRKRKVQKRFFAFHWSDRKKLWFKIETNEWTKVLTSTSLVCAMYLPSFKPSSSYPSSKIYGLM